MEGEGEPERARAKVQRAEKIRKVRDPGPMGKFFGFSKGEVSVRQIYDFVRAEGAKMLKE